MATYSQWRKAVAAGKPPARLTWVCGAETVLVNEVADHIIGVLLPQAEQVHLLTVGDVGEAMVWDTIAGCPAGGGRKVVMVREAQLLKQTGNLEWAAEHARGLRYLHLLFVSAEEDFARVEENGKKTLAPHLAALQASTAGQLVRCAPLNERDAVTWIQAKLDVDDSLALHIWQSAGLDAAEAATLCAKLALFAGSVSAALVDELSSGLAAESFADVLVRGDKAAALAALPDPATLGAVIGLLAGRLDLLATLHGPVTQGMNAADMRTKLRLTPFTISRWRDVARSYTPAVVQRRRQHLAVADAAWRGGARTGVAEYIAALW